MPDVKVENPNAFALLGDVLKAMDKVEGKVGWFENSAYPDGTPVAYVAAIQEMGSPQRRIPSRSFFRSTALDKNQKWRELAAAISSKILEKKITPETGMEMLCLQAEGDVADKISKISAPPLSQITLGVRKYKQMGKKITGATIGEIARLLKDGKLDVSGVSTKPLVDSAIMVNTLTSVVEK
jgi:hypothetical protein